MTPRTRAIAAVCLAILAVALLAPTRADDSPRPKADRPKAAPEYPPGATDAEKREIDLQRFRGKDADPGVRDALLAAYPFESLEDRLRFDPPGRKRVAGL